MVTAGLVELPKYSDLGGTGQDEAPSSDLIEVDILVYTRDRNPIDSVEVSFLLKGTRISKLTNTVGYTQIQVPSNENIDIILQKEGFQTQSHNIDPKIDPNKNREYVLEPIQSNE